MSETAAPGEQAREMTVFEFVGGEPFFAELVERFYAGVMGDELLAPMYQEQDLEGAKGRLRGFLVQFWGGPDDYSQERGHPRLRMRHFPFAIGVAERDRWMHHMRSAVLAADTVDQVKDLMLGYFENSATAMQNQ